ncbi:MAG: hypothetical protein BWY82_00964 [Verrucomicrobia bacterium ADurb.Bin474]|nr:MAG: hypothetical protein BWY82_00964 [Verrucomicrobia bacterium ADurb.Bin474]
MRGACENESPVPIDRGLNGRTPVKGKRILEVHQVLHGPLAASLLRHFGRRLIHKPEVPVRERMP